MCNAEHGLGFSRQDQNEAVEFLAKTKTNMQV